MFKEVIVANGYGTIKPIGLVIHSTANPGATARNHANYWANGADYYTHYVSDWDEALHTVNDDRLCYHCGNGNSKYLGIEICEATNRADFEAGWDIAVRAARAILDKHGWTVKNMVSHDWVRRNLGGTTHTDPMPYFNRWGRTWDNFVDDVREAGDKSDVAKAIVRTNGGRLMMRKRPFIGSKVLKRLENRTVVVVLKRGRLWTKCRHKGTTGYCSTRYLEFRGTK